VRLRIGLHTGEAEAQGESYFGPAVNVATCLAAAAHGNQTLVSGATATLLAGGSELFDLGSYRLEGVPNDQRIFQLGEGRHPPVRNSNQRRRGNLPRRTGRLFGRHDDVRLIGQALIDSPVVTLVGPGGIGKTRLSLAVAEVADADTTWLVELAAVALSSDVTRAIANTMEVHESPGRTLTDAIVDALRQRPALLVLDNCEHVIDGAARCAAVIVEHCPEVHVLATSREQLGIRGERVISVAPLDPTTAGAELFDERATAVSPTFDLHSSRREVDELCRRLEGVPLAIELAAAQTRTMSPADLLQRIGNPLRVLTGSRRDGVEHHRTLRAAIQWSYDLLSPRQQVLFQRLSMFVGPFDLAAAEAVAADDRFDVLDVGELLGALVDQSVVLAEPGPFGRRFRLLESMRQLGAEHLAASGGSELMAGRHARWCVHQAAAVHRLLRGLAEIEGVARLSELWPNLRAAVDWACGQRDGRLARELIAPVAAEGHLRSQSEIADWAERILDFAPPDDHDLIVFCLALAARRHWRTQDRDGFERLVERYGEPDHLLIHHARALVYEDFEALVRWCPIAAAELRRSGDDVLAQLAEFGVGRALLALGRLEEGDAVVSALAARYREFGPPTFLSWALTMLSYAAAALGDRARATQLLDEAASVAVPERTHVSTKPIEATAAFRRGDRATAFDVLRTHAIALLQTDDLYETSAIAVAFVDMMTTLGHVAEVARVLGYLQAHGKLEHALWRADVADAVTRVGAADDAALDDERSVGMTLDHRQVLTFISDVLARLNN
jgi:predicted ATPase